MLKKKGEAKEAYGYCRKQSTKTTKPVLIALYDMSSERADETMKDSLCKIESFSRVRVQSKAATASFMRWFLTKAFLSTEYCARFFFIIKVRWSYSTLPWSHRLFVQRFMNEAFVASASCSKPAKTVRRKILVSSGSYSKTRSIIPLKSRHLWMK